MFKIVIVEVSQALSLRVIDWVEICSQKEKQMKDSPLIIFEFLYPKFHRENVLSAAPSFLMRAVNLFTSE